MKPAKPTVEFTTNRERVTPARLNSSWKTSFTNVTGELKLANARSRARSAKSGITNW